MKGLILYLILITGLLCQQQNSNEQNPQLENNILTTQQFTIKYKIVNQQYLQLNIQGLHKSWIGIGYGSGMSNVDMTILAFQNGQVVAEDFWGLGKGSIVSDLAEKGSNNVELVGNVNTYDPQTGLWNVTIQRPIMQIDYNLDSAIVLNKPTKLSFALGQDPNFNLNGHLPSTVVDITYYSNNESNNNNPQQQSFPQKDTENQGNTSTNTNINNPSQDNPKDTINNNNTNTNSKSTQGQNPYTNQSDSHQLIFNYFISILISILFL